MAGVVLGALLRHFWHAIAVQMQPFGDGFIKLVRMIIAPIVVLAFVVGIAKLSDAKKVGRIGLKAIIYFGVMSPVAMFIVWSSGICCNPARNVDPHSFDSRAVAQYANAPEQVREVLNRPGREETAVMAE